MNNNNYNPGNLEIDYLDLLPLGYKKSAKTLIYKINKAQNNAEKLQLLQDFSETFIMLPKIWKFWYKLVWYNASLTSHCGIIFERAAKDFPQVEEREWPVLDDFQKLPNLRTLTTEEFTKALKPYVILPHSMLQTAFDFYAEKNDETEEITQQHKKACKIYKEMKEADIKDGKKYIETLKKTNNDEFVIKNIESQLAKNPWCRNFWMAFIHYLENEKKDYKALLSVLQRYCRLFIKDKTMKEKYRSKIEQLSHVLKGMWEFRVDLIKFELQFESVDAAMKLLDKALKTEMYEKIKFFNAALELAEEFKQSKMIEKIEKVKKAHLKNHPETDDYNFIKVMKNLSFNRNTKMQNFPFPKPLSQYLYDNFDYQHLQKLYQTCKWFYCKYRYNLVHRFEHNFKVSTGMCRHPIYPPAVEYTKYSVVISNNVAINQTNLKHLWITHSLNLQSLNTNPSVLNIIKKATLKYLTLRSTHLTEKEFELLTKSKTVEKFTYNRSSITKADGTEYMLEDIIMKLPKLRHADILCHVTAETGERLQEINFHNKMQYFNLICRGGPLNAEHCYNFLLKYLSPNAKVNMICSGINNGFDVVNYIKQKISSEWKPQNEKPKFSSNYIAF